jgi:hypothetical protein
VISVTCVRLLALLGWFSCLLFYMQRSQTYVSHITFGEELETYVGLRGWNARPETVCARCDRQQPPFSASTFRVTYTNRGTHPPSIAVPVKTNWTKMHHGTVAPRKVENNRAMAQERRKWVGGLDKNEVTYGQKRSPMIQCLISVLDRGASGTDGTL